MLVLKKFKQCSDKSKARADEQQHPVAQPDLFSIFSLKLMQCFREKGAVNANSNFIFFSYTKLIHSINTKYAYFDISFWLYNFNI